MAAGTIALVQIPGTVSGILPLIGRQQTNGGKGIARFQPIEFGGQRRDIIVGERHPQTLGEISRHQWCEAWREGPCPADGQRQGCQGTGDTLLQALPVKRLQSLIFKTVRIARHDYDIGGEPPHLLGTGDSWVYGQRQKQSRAPGNNQERGDVFMNTARQNQAVVLGQFGNADCMGRALSADHSTIEPSYILACLLPRISDDVNQPSDAQ